MSHVLAITSSPLSQGSVTTSLVERFVDTWIKADADGHVVSRNVATSNLPHIDEAMIGGFFTPEADRTEVQNIQLELSNALVAEVEAADVVVIGAPMHNFGITSSLKSWIDHISRVGRTFSYTESGPVGHLTGKKVFVLSARGGNYSKSGNMSHLDHQEPYLRTVLGFMGLMDVTFIHAEGVASGTEGREAAEQLLEEAIASTFKLAA